MFSAEELEQAVEAYLGEDGWWEAEWQFKTPQVVEVAGHPYEIKLVFYNSGLNAGYKENYITDVEMIFSADGRLFRKNGYYQSFTGGDFSGPFEEVKATEKTVTVYESV